MAGGLGEDERGLRRARGEQGDGGGLTREFLGEEFDVGEVAIGESAQDYFAAAGCRGLGQQGGGLGGGEIVEGLLVLFAQGFDFIERLAGLLGKVVDVGGKECGGGGEGGKIAAGGGDGAQAGNEFDAVSVANFFGFAQEEAGDLAGVGDVGSTARGEIEIVNVDEAKLVAVGGRKFAQAEAGCFVASDEADIDGTILEDDFVGQAFGGFDLIRGERRGVEIVDLQINRAVIIGHVERDGGHVEEAKEGGGENVLGGVLLHVVAAAGGVDLAVDAGSGLNIFDGGFEVVDDVAVFGVGDFGDAEFDGGVFRGKPSGVVNLAAAGGIEGGAVENERGTRGFED